jgi:hypothetical protein
MTLEVSSEIAAGATGVVYNAMLEVSTTSTGVQSLKAVVKFAFEREQQKRLRHEFSIYEHLASLEVDNIPTVFGLFEDTESDVLALIMTHVGVCLLDRGPGALETTALPLKTTATILKTVPNPKTASNSTTTSHSNTTASNIRLVVHLLPHPVD